MTDAYQPAYLQDDNSLADYNNPNLTMRQRVGLDPVSPPSAPTPAPTPSKDYQPQYLQPAYRDPSGLLHVTITPKSPQIGTADALLSGAKRGLSANFNDEISGVAAASGLPGDIGGYNSIGAQLPIGAARLAYEHLTGKPGEATKAYNDAVDKIRQYQQEVDEQHPIASTVGQVGGAVATGLLPVGVAGQGASLAARAGIGAAAGGAYGALYGAGEGTTPEDRLQRAATGGAIGAVTGGVTPPVLAGAGKVAGVVSDKVGAILGHPLQALQANRNIDQAATQRAAELLRYDVENGRGGMTAPDVAAAQKSGQPVMLGDLGGPATQDAMRAAANTSPAGRAALETATQGRFAGQAQRVSDLINQWRGGSSAPTAQPRESLTAKASRTLRNMFGGANATQDVEDLRDAARRANGPAYQRAYTAGDREIWSPELERLTAAPYVQGALRGAISKWKNFAIRDGFGAMNPPFRVENGGLIRTGGSGLPAYPNLQLWDYAARELQDRARAAPRGSQVGMLYNDLARLVKNEVDRMAPEYREAREGAASFFRAGDALEAGRSFFSSNADIGEARQAIGRMSQPERELFARGYASEHADWLEHQGDAANILGSSAVSSPAARQKMEMALGPQRSGQIQSMIGEQRAQNTASEALANTFGGAANHFEAGQKFVMSGDLGPARAALNRMSAPERNQFANGFVDALSSRVMKIANNRNVTIDRMFNSQDGKARIAMAVGPGRSQELEMFLRREDMMDLARKAVSGNSTTVRQLMTKALLNAGAHGAVGAGIGASVDELLSGHMNWKHVLLGGVLAGTGVATTAVNTKLAQSVAEKLASDDPKVWRDVLRVAANNPTVANTVRRGEAFLEKLAGHSAGNNAPAITAGAIPAAADEQQQQ